MLERKVIKGVGLLAKSLQSKGVALESIEDTPVDVLVGSTVVITADDGGAEVLDAVATSDITSTSTGPLPTSHNVEFDSAVELGAQAVRAELYHAQNVVAPAVETLTAKIRESLEVHVDKHLFNFDIQIEEISPVLKDGNMLALLEEHANNGRVLPTGAVFSFGERTVDEIKSWLGTGFKKTDEAIDLWVAGLSDDFFLDTWSRVFNNGHVGEGGSLMTALGNTERATLVYLLARYLRDNPIEGSGLGLTDYTRHLNTLKNLAGEVLFHQLKRLNDSIEAGYLIKEVVSRKDGSGCRCIVVQGEVYRPWVEAGGDINTLYGLVLSRPDDVLSIATIKQIEERAEEYQKAFLSHHNLAVAAIEQKRGLLLRQIIAAEFQRWLDSEYEGQVGKEGEAQRIFSHFREELSKMGDGRLVQLEDALLSLMCGAVWPDKHSYFVLSRMDYHCKANPSLTPREAASIAVIELVTDWVAGQIRVVKAD